MESEALEIIQDFFLAYASFLLKARRQENQIGPIIVFSWYSQPDNQLHLMVQRMKQRIAFGLAAY